VGVTAAALRIGPLTVDPPVVLAPMAGVTNGPFRALCRAFGAGLYVSEMVTARALVEGNAKTRRMVARDGPGPHSVQLYGVDPVTMGEAVRILVGDVGADHVDLNFGCPVPKVTRKGGGAALPLHPVLLRLILAASVRAAAPSGVPVTVKVRMGLNDGCSTFRETGRIAEGEGAAAVALHARTAEQHYAGPAHWPAIAELKELVTTVPVLGNGDIWDGGDALAMMAATGCDGVVVGRGCLGRPWIFGDLVDAFAGRPAPVPPLLGQVVAVMADHARRLCEWFGPEAGAREMRKHVPWYLLGYPVGGEARRALQSAADLGAFRAVLDGLDPCAGLIGGVVPRPRGHSHGPRRVVLPHGWLEHREDPTPPLGAELIVSGG
jgi:nifR3 family TIM-barrel protein